MKLILKAKRGPILKMLVLSFESKSKVNKHYLILESIEREW